MNIEQKDNNNKNGLFIARVDGEDAGKMTYTWLGSHRIRIDHTVVKEAFSGKGVGKKLVLEAVAMAKEKSLKIVPKCPFAQSVFKKDSSIQDVLDKEELDF